MPVIRVDDDVFRELQKRAAPFVDTPNTVLRRELGLEEVSATSRRAAQGSGIPRRLYHETLLKTVADAGGRIRRTDAIAEVGRRLEGTFTPVDLSETETGRLRWRVRTAWARKYLVQEGYLSGDSERGVWELTDKGRTRLEELQD